MLWVLIVIAMCAGIAYLTLKRSPIKADVTKIETKAKSIVKDIKP